MANPPPLQFTPQDVAEAKKHSAGPGMNAAVAAAVQSSLGIHPDLLTPVKPYQFTPPTVLVPLPVEPPKSNTGSAAGTFNPQLGVNTAPRNPIPDLNPQLGDHPPGDPPGGGAAVALVAGALLENAFDFLIAQGAKPNGIAPPPKIGDKLKTAKDLATGLPKAPVQTIKDTIRDPIAQRIALFIVIGQITGQSLAAQPLNTGEESALANSQLATDLAVKAAAGQTTPLTPAEIAAVQAKAVTPAQAAEFVAAFNAAAAKNAAVAAGQNALALLSVAGFPGLTYLNANVDPLTGLQLWPRDRTDP